LIYYQGKTNRTAALHKAKQIYEQNLGVKPSHTIGASCALRPLGRSPRLAIAWKCERERWIAELVKAAYGLTAEEVALLWRTALLRMPGESPGV
jgi:hypothetical protein